MALIKCDECGKEISGKAESCPNCGTPHKKRSNVFGVLLVVFAVIFAIGLINRSSDEQPSEPKPIISLQGVLAPFFKDIPTVQWVIYNGKQVYVGFDANFDPDRPGPLKIIMGNAARLASNSGHRAIELWAVDAKRSDIYWRPENGIEALMLTKITYSGSVIHVQ